MNIWLKTLLLLFAGAFGGVLVSAVWLALGAIVAITGAGMAGVAFVPFWALFPVLGVVGSVKAAGWAGEYLDRWD